MWEDVDNFADDNYSHISHLYRSSSSFASGEIVRGKAAKNVKLL